MTFTKLPEATALPSLSTEERARVLDLLFEPSQPLHSLSVELLKTQQFTSYDDLIASIGNQLTDLAESSSTSDSQWLESILGAHPRLGAKKVESAQSKSEQARLQQGNETESKELADLNEQYERTYPGLRYVVFVNGRDRPTIMADMRRRIATGDMEAERFAAIKAMCEIAADRARKLESGRT